MAPSRQFSTDNLVPAGEVPGTPAGTILSLLFLQERPGSACYCFTTESVESKQQGEIANPRPVGPGSSRERNRELEVYGPSRPGSSTAKIATLTPMGSPDPEAPGREVANLKPIATWDLGAAGSKIVNLKPMAFRAGSRRERNRETEAYGLLRPGSSRVRNREPEAYGPSGPGSSAERDREPEASGFPGPGSSLSCKEAYVQFLRRLPRSPPLGRSLQPFRCRLPSSSLAGRLRVKFQG